MNFRFRILFTAGAILAALESEAAIPLDSLGIEVRDRSRPFVYTNKQTAFLYGETGSENRDSWQGFNVFGHEFLDDYLLFVDGVELPRSNAVRTVVYPDYLVREYPGGIVEQLRPADSLAAVGVIITSPAPITVTFVPLFSDGRALTDFTLRTRGATALIARSTHLRRTPAENFPVWLACGGGSFGVEESTTTSGSRFSPLRLASLHPATTHMLAFAVGDDEEDAAAQARAWTDDPARWFRIRRERMNALLALTSIETADARFDRALAWAKLSLDALMMNQITHGIFAGLPWFNNYWGRDTFIALPGACLVTGRFAEAKAILRSFAEFQQRDSLSTDFGRIPNLVTTTDRAYNTADGTPRFTAMALDYILRSGDTLFAREIAPVIERSITGTLRYHTDVLGFLTHGDAETWMDAVGPDGPWSPRGNRANDVQALWIAQLRAGAAITAIAGRPSDGTRWLALADSVIARFGRLFVSDSMVADHLKADGSPDRSLRPNQLFTTSLLDAEHRTAVVKSVAGALAYPYGVASLAQNDPNFHPYHQYEPSYPKDAAYHNGTVWTWLQGPLISELCRSGDQDTAFTITANSVHQILDRAAVGTQSELLDALARPGEAEPRPSGTVSQAWNLGEFIRNFYDDYLGVRLTRYDHRLVIHPRLPRALGPVRAVINLDGVGLPVEIAERNGIPVVTVDGRRLRKGGTGVFTLPAGDGKEIETEVVIPARARLRFEVRGGVPQLAVNGRSTPGGILRHRLLPVSRIPGLHLAVPRLVPGLRALQGPDYPLLDHKLVTRTNPQAEVLADLSDVERDETTTYSYPLNAAFIPGCLDITHFRVTADDSLAYFTLTFRALSNPGWHPEYGFQLTYAAIAVDEDREPGSGRRAVGHNAGFLIDENRGYERLVLVGGGVQIEDSAGTILAAYRPVAEDAGAPFGNAKQGTVAFALPRSLLGDFGPGARFTVLVGAQDDHGGAGLGEFRTVNAVQGEWNGGGKNDPSAPNIYDVLISP